MIINMLTNETIEIQTNTIPYKDEDNVDNLDVRDIICSKSISYIVDNPDEVRAYVDDVDRLHYAQINDNVFVMRVVGVQMTADVNAPAQCEVQLAGSERMNYVDYVLMMLPPAVREHMYQWCDPRLQGLTNEEVVKTKMLKDLSGHGFDYTLFNFAGNAGSGIDEDGALYFDGVDDYAVSDRPRLDDFTVVVDADCYKGNGHQSAHYYILSADYPYSPPNRPFMLSFDDESEVGVDRAYFTHSFGEVVKHNEARATKEGVTVLTPTALNGATIKRGTYTDDKEAKLCLADLRQGRKLFTRIRYRSIINFDKSLSDSQLHIVRKLMIERETPRWLTILQSMSQSLRDALYCWHNPRLQELDNQSLVWLWDLSGNGHDCKLYNFGGTSGSGMRADGGLQFDGVDDVAFEVDNFSEDNTHTSITCLLDMTVQTAPVFAHLFAVGTDSDCASAIAPMMLSQVDLGRLRMQSNSNTAFLYVPEDTSHFVMSAKFDEPRAKYFNGQKGTQVLDSRLPEFGRLGRISYATYNRTTNNFVRIPRQILYSMTMFTRLLTTEEEDWVRRNMM